MTKEQNKVTYSVTWDEFEKTMYHTNTRIILAIEEYDNLMKETEIIGVCVGDSFEINAVDNGKTWRKKYKVESVIEHDRWGNNITDWDLQEMRVKFKTMILSKKYELEVKE